MWFRACRLYDFEDQKFPYTSEQLEAALEEFAFKGCGPHDMKYFGWTSPLPQGSSLIYEQGPYTLICLQKEEKILPNSVVQEQAQERINTLEYTEGRKLRKQERATIKEDVINLLLPQAFTKTTRYEALIDRNHGRFLVNTSSAKIAEHVIISLRRALGSLKLNLPAFDAPGLRMTDWLNKKVTPAGWLIDHSCVIQDGLESKGLIRCQNQDLFGEDIQSLLSGRREVVALKMNFRDEVSFMLKEDGSLTGIKFLDEATKRLDGITSETPEERFDADFSIMSEVLVGAVEDLYTAMTD